MAVKAKAEITLSRIIDIESVTRYYLLQSSTASAPSKPTANPPGGNWKTTEPSYTSGSTNTLYFVDLTVMTNGTFGYSAVSKSSSYEAAKEAWNKANNAQNSIDSLQVGGRNLFLKTGVEVSNNAYHIVSYTPANDPLTAGETYTATICITPGTGLDHVSLYFSGGYAAQCSLYINGTDKQIISKTFKLYYSTDRKPSDNPAYGYADFYRFPNDGTVTTNTTIQWVKIEKGNKPTDWTPAPEDMATAEALETTDTAMSELADQVDARITATETDIDAVNQVISNLIVDENGGSLMKQTTDGWVFSMAEIMGQVQQATDDLKTLEGNLDDQGGSIDALQNAVNALETLTSYVRITTEGDEPCIELGNHGSFKVRITNTSIDFMDGTSIPAYINNQSLKIDKAEVENELAFGKFAFKERDNGNMGLIWKG